MIDWVFDKARIVLAMEARGVSRKELADMINATVQQVQQWENGDVTPGIDSLVKIVNALQTPPWFFFVQSGYNGNDND